MTEIEQQLRAAMRKSVDAEEAVPSALIAAVRRRHRRRNRLLACAVLLVIVAVAIPAVIVGRAAVVSQGPAAHRSVPAKHLPKTLTGLPLPAGTNMQLLVPDPNGWAEWYSTATGTTTPIAGFPSYSADGDAQFGRVQGGFVVTLFLLHRGPFVCAGQLCAGPAQNYYFVADGASVATKIGAGLVDTGVASSGHAGAVWLTSYPHSSDIVATTSAITQLVSTTGHALGPRYQLPAGYRPDAGVGSYLLLDPASKGYVAGPPVFLLWDPATHRVVRRIVDAFAAGPDQIAWTQGCRGCRLQILNVATGKNLSTSIPAGPQTAFGGNATFSDNGQLLRFATPSGATAQCCRTYGAVAIVSTSSGRSLAVIPGLSKSRWQIVQWLAGGPALLVADGPARGDGLGSYTGVDPTSPPPQIGLWQPGDTRVRVATLTPGPQVRLLLQSGAG